MYNWTSFYRSSKSTVLRPKPPPELLSDITPENHPIRATIIALMKLNIGKRMYIPSARPEKRRGKQKFGVLLIRVATIERWTELGRAEDVVLPKNSISVPGTGLGRVVEFLCVSTVVREYSYNWGYGSNVWKRYCDVRWQVGLPDYNGGRFVSRNNV